MVAPLLADLPLALKHWKRSDPLLHALAKRHPPGPRGSGRRSAFATLAGSIISQQVSVAAARTIYGRLEAACGGRVTPDRILALPPDALQGVGLSRGKTAYITDLAAKVAAREVDTRRFSRMTDEEVIADLTRVKGIGRWTAQMFLIFHLHRPDVLAPDDLGLQLAAAILYGVPAKEARALLIARGPSWSPYASLASLTLWDSRRIGPPTALPRGGK